MISGVNNSQGVADLLESGTELAAFYPAGCAGGPEMLEVLSRPNMHFIPWGGIDPLQAVRYLSFPAVPAIAVDWFSGARAGNGEECEAIARRAERAVLSGLGFSLAHVGINMPNEEEAAYGAKALSGVFGMPWRRGRASFFVAEQWEIFAGRRWGERGHLAIGTGSLERALHYLQSQCGIHVRQETITYRDDGVMRTAYIDFEIGGFAVHLVRRD